MKNRWIQIAIVAVGSYLIWVAAKSLIDLKKAGGRLEEAKMALVQAKKDNTDLKRKLNEVSSPEFIEKEARDKLNLQKPGEVVVVMSENGLIAQKNNKIALEKVLTNPEKWWKLLFE